MKETNAERIKREKDGLSVWTDILRYARDGSAPIDPDDLDRLKWYGLYTQHPVEDGLFMLRIKVPNGILSAEQLETVGWLSEFYGRSSGDLTTRQDIQLHNIQIADVPHIIDELKSIGLTTQEACGDVVRNVVGCPLAGVDDDELVDASPLVRRVMQLFIDNRDFSNLPRKFKISISGCAQRCAQHEINDVGLVAVTNDEGEVGFDLWVGGGLGARPRLAERLGAFIWYDEVPEVVTRIVELFRDHGDRSDRRKARMKFLLAKWGVSRFRAELETRLGRNLDDSVLSQPTRVPRRNHLGISAQRQAGFHYIGVAVLAGRISGAQMTSVAGLARRYASGRVRLTNAQNLIVLDAPRQHVGILDSELAALGLNSHASPFRRGTVACTGSQFCKLAVVETKDRAKEIVKHLEAALPDFRNDVRISVTGCINSCAQYQICDIGLVGVNGQIDGEEANFFQIHLGGQVGRGARFGVKLSRRVRVEKAKYYIEDIVRTFHAERWPDETFADYIARQEPERLETLDGNQHVKEVFV